MRAKVAKLEGLSAHADRATMLRWLSAFKQPPRKLFLTHGEEEAANALAGSVRENLGWTVEVPEYQQVAELE